MCYKVICLIMCNKVTCLTMQNKVSCLTMRKKVTCLIMENKVTCLSILIKVTCFRISLKYLNKRSSISWFDCDNLIFETVIFESQNSSFLNLHGLWWIFGSSPLRTFVFGDLQIWSSVMIIFASYLGFNLNFVVNSHSLK